MLQFRIQSTPNPHARKYILSTNVKTEGKVSYSDPSECSHVPLATALLKINGVKQVHFFENVLTITQNGEINWAILDQQVQDVVLSEIDTHDVNFVDIQDREPERRAQLSEAGQKIESILDLTIRPGLQADGGDVEVIDIQDNIVTLRYLGACGGCPSSMEGTLEAIKAILRDEYDPAIEVVAV
jgi:Fe-S cluster biogenesis protein NfuA